MRELEAEADELASRERTLLEEIRLLEIDRQIKTEELAVIDGDLAVTTGQLEETAAQMGDLEREVDAQRPLVEARLVALYKMGTPGYTRLLLGSGDLRAIGRNYRLIGSLTRRDREQFEDLRQTVANLEVSRSKLEDRQARGCHTAEHGACGTSGARAHHRVADGPGRRNRYPRRRDLTAQLAGELEAARERLKASLAELAADTRPGATTLMLPLRPFRGQIEPPMPGEVIVAYGASRSTEFGATIAGGGIELAVTPGEPVYAIHKGEVVSVGSFEGLGTLVIVSHGDQAFSLYGYLASLAGHEGVVIDQRAELGTAGLSPTGDPTVYFELRIDGRPVDPIEWLKQ